MSKSFSLQRLIRMKREGEINKGNALETVGSISSPSRDEESNDHEEELYPRVADVALQEEPLLGPDDLIWLNKIAGQQAPKCIVGVVAVHGLDDEAYKI